MVTDDTSVFCGRLRTIGNVITNGHTLDMEIKHLEALKLLDMLGSLGKELPGVRALARRKQLKRLWLHGNPKLAKTEMVSPDMRPLISVRARGGMIGGVKRGRQWDRKEG